MKENINIFIQHIHLRKKQELKNDNWSILKSSEV